MTPSIDLKTSALLVNECQLGMTNPHYSNLKGLASEVQERGMLKQVAALAAAFRSSSRPVVHCTIVPLPGFVGFSANCLVLGIMKKHSSVFQGQAAAEIDPQVEPSSEDIVVERRQGLTPFHGTELAALLRNLGVDTVVIAGVSTNIGIFGAAIEAVNCGFQVLVPEDCTAGADAISHQFQVSNTLPLLATMTTARELVETLSTHQT
jgi:nicotinamidase-related amidase